MHLDLPPSGLAASAGKLWAIGYNASALDEVDIATGQVVARHPVGTGPSAVLVAAGSVWVTNSLDGTLTRVDAATVWMLTTFPMPAALAARGWLDLGGERVLGQRHRGGCGRAATFWRRPPRAAGRQRSQRQVQSCGSAPTRPAKPAQGRHSDPVRGDRAELPRSGVPLHGFPRADAAAAPGLRLARDLRQRAWRARAPAGPRPGRGAAPAHRRRQDLRLPAPAGHPVLRRAARQWGLPASVRAPLSRGSPGVGF